MVNLPRRRFLCLAAGAAALPAISRVAVAETYPARPVRLLVGYPPGGPNDILARLIGQWLQERLGQPFVVENRPSAGGNVATESVVRGAADGYTLLIMPTAVAINATLYDKLSFNVVRDIAPVATIARAPNVIVVHPSFPARTVPELIAFANANPGKLGMASPGIGTSPHMSGELFKMMTGVDMFHVPYRGSAPGLTDLLGGQVPVMFVDLPASITHIKSGKLRALAVTTATRSEMLPDVPTVGDSVPGFEASAFFGIGAARSTPSGIVERLNKEINAALVDPKITARLADLGAAALILSPGEFGDFIAEQTEKWGKVVKFSGAKPS